VFGNIERQHQAQVTALMLPFFLNPQRNLGRRMDVTEMGENTDENRSFYHDGGPDLRASRSLGCPAHHRRTPA
jgi:hypothetical protein